MYMGKGKYVFRRIRTPHLQRLAQPHVVSQDAIQTALSQPHQPAQTLQVLAGRQNSRQAGRQARQPVKYYKLLELRVRTSEAGTPA
jgi:hypothetical protein